MQALILAAGMGRRLGKYTESHTKCMVSVAGKTLLLRAVEALKKADIDRLIMVVGYQSESLISYIKSEKVFQEMKIDFVYNYDYAHTNNIYSLHLAKEYLKADDTVLLESDLIFDDVLIKGLIEDKRPNLVVTAKYEQWMDGTVVTVDGAGRILDFIGRDKFQYDDVDKYYKTVNIYKFSKEFSEKKYLPFLDAYLTAYGTNQYYEQVLNIFSHIRNSELEAFQLNNIKWYEIDDSQDLDIADTMFANDEDILNKYEYHFGGYWRFPHVTDFCYLVNPYYPPEKMISQLKYTFTQLLTQYPSGMSIQRLNAESMFDVDEKHLIVGNGAAELINLLGKYVSGRMSVFVPTFNEYNRCFTNCSIQKIESRQYDYKYNIDAILREVAHTDYLLLINPDNPSGSFISREDMFRIMEACKDKSVKLIIDESFIDFAAPQLRYTLLKEEWIRNYENLIVVKSISKSHGVPGLRLGVMATSDTKLLAFMRKNIAIWNINSFAEYYLQIQRLYKASYWSACNQIVKQRNRMIANLQNIPYLKVYPSQANYIMCRLDDASGWDSKKLAIELLKKSGLLVKNLSDKQGFEGESYLRFAIKDEACNGMLITALGEILEN